MSGFECEQSAANLAVYLWKKGGRLGIFIAYLDDFLLFNEDNLAAAKNIGNFQKEFKISVDEKIEKFLSFSAEATGKCVKLHNAPKIRRLFKCSKIKKCKVAITRLQPGLNLSGDGGELIGEKTLHRQLVGTLLHFAKMVQSDIMYAAGYLARFIRTPSDSSWRVGKHVHRYLKKTKRLEVA